ncbi:MAG: hypothetical protein ACYTEL_13975 [Planctomycetota bacterium]
MCGSLPTLVDLHEFLIMTFRIAPTGYEMLWIIAEYRIMAYGW